MHVLLPLEFSAVFMPIQESRCITPCGMLEVPVSVWKHAPGSLYVYSAWIQVSKV
jgi:hypothetical protein